MTGLAELKEDLRDTEEQLARLDRVLTAHPEHRALKIDKSSLVKRKTRLEQQIAQVQEQPAPKRWVLKVSVLALAPLVWIVGRVLRQRDRVD